MTPDELRRLNEKAHSQRHHSKESKPRTSLPISVPRIVRIVLPLGILAAIACYGNIKLMQNRSEKSQREVAAMLAPREREKEEARRMQLESQEWARQHPTVVISATPNAPATPATPQQEAQKRTAYAEGFKDGQGWIRSGKMSAEQLNVEIQILAANSMSDNFPKLEQFSELKEAYVSGFAAGYKAPVSQVTTSTQSPPVSSELAAARQLNAEQNARAMAAGGNARPYMTAVGFSGSTMKDAESNARARVPQGGTIVNATYGSYYTPDGHLAWKCTIQYR